MGNRQRRRQFEELVGSERIDEDRAGEYSPDNLVAYGRDPENDPDEICPNNTVHSLLADMAEIRRRIASAPHARRTLLPVAIDSRRRLRALRLSAAGRR